jgi:hypothetical protein
MTRKPHALVAVDPGTHLGWAVAHADGAIDSGAEHFDPARHEREGMRFLRVRVFLQDLKRGIEARGEVIAYLGYERVNFLPPETKNGRAPVKPAHIYGAIWGVMTAWCEANAIPYHGYAPLTLKAEFVGNHKADKFAVVEALLKRGFAPKSQDEADALGLLHLLLARRAAVAELRARGHDVVEAFKEPIFIVDGRTMNGLGLLALCRAGAAATKPVKAA